MANYRAKMTSDHYDFLRRYNDAVTRIDERLTALENGVGDEVPLVTEFPEETINSMPFSDWQPGELEKMNKAELRALASFQRERKEVWRARAERLERELTAAEATAKMWRTHYSQLNDHYAGLLEKVRQLAALTDDIAKPI